MITTRNTARAMSALRVTVLPHLDPTTLLDTWLGWTPVTRAMSERTLAIWSELSDSVCTITRPGLPGCALVTWTTLATEPTPLETSAWVTGWAGRTVKTPPPLKSMPNRSPGKNRAITEISMARPEIRNHVRQRPTKSKLSWPWYRRLAMDTGVDSSSFEILDSGADAHEPPLLEQPRPGEQAHRRPAVEPGGEEVDERGQAEGEREPPDRPDGEQVQDHGGRE